MMSQDDQGLLSVRSNSSTTTRRALNSLQYASNGKDVVGLSPRKSSRLNIMMNSNTNINNKKVDMSCGINQPLSKSRTSISLPDISGSKSIAARSPAILALCASTSTPHRKSNASSTKSPSKSGSSAVARKNISVIMEEKENPNAAMSLAAAKSTSRPKMPKFKSSSTQCDLIDELMVTGDVETTDLTPYWKLIAHKRLAALDEAEAETVQVNRHMAEMNEENETLRNKIACYVEILRQYDEIKKQILESIDCCDEDEDEDDEDDSGYEKSTLSTN